MAMRKALNEGEQWQNPNETPSSFQNILLLIKSFVEKRHHLQRCLYRNLTFEASYGRLITVAFKTFIVSCDKLCFYIYL